MLLSGRPLVFSYPTVHTQQSRVPNGVAEHNVAVGLHRPCLGLQRMLVHSRVCFLYGVPYLQQVTLVLYDLHERVKVRNDLKGAEHQRGAAAGASSARSCRSAPTETSCSPSSGCRTGWWAHDVQRDNLPARRLEGPAHRLGAAELQKSRHFS